MKRLIYNYLHYFYLRLLCLQQNFVINRLVYWVSKILDNYEGNIETKIHGYTVKINSRYTYQKTIRKFPNYNDPLCDIVAEISTNKNREINIVEVGAALGDTALLLLSNFNSRISKIHCIDGNEEFFELLVNNLKGEKKATPYFCLLNSSDNSLIPELVKIHDGTASAQGKGFVNAMTLDTFVELNEIRDIDLIKIDVDGYDGEVIKGSSRTISKYKCPIIFEFHPALVKATGNQIEEFFTTLKECNYTKCFWFTKYGVFSHYTETQNTPFEFYEELSLRNNFEQDWHYDIIALNELESLDVFNVIERKYSAIKKSYF